MNPRYLKKIDWYVIGWGVLITAGAGFFREGPIFLGALIGAVLASVNWTGFRYLGVRMAATANRARFGVFLAIKMAAMLAAVAFVVRSHTVDTLAFIGGLSALVLGILTSAAAQAISEGEQALGEEQ